MYPLIRIEVNGGHIIDSTNLNFNFRDSNRLLVKGIVLNSYSEPISNAGIEVLKQNINTNETFSIGVIFTDLNGIYCVSLEVTNEFNYSFIAYSPI